MDKEKRFALKEVNELFNLSERNNQKRISYRVRKLKEKTKK